MAIFSKISKIIYRVNTLKSGIQPSSSFLYFFLKNVNLGSKMKNFKISRNSPQFLYYTNIIHYYPTRGNTIGFLTGSSAGISEGISAGSEFIWASGSAGTGTILLDSGAAGTIGWTGSTGDCGIIAGLGARGNSLSTSIT